MSGFDLDAYQYAKKGYGVALHVKPHISTIQYTGIAIGGPSAGLQISSDCRTVNVPVLEAIYKSGYREFGISAYHWSAGAWYYYRTTQAVPTHR